MRVKTTVWLWTALATMLLIGGSSLGQSSGSITGTVKDSNGGAIAGASVTLTNPANSVTQSATTNDSGIFVSAQLPPGTYVIRREQARLQAAGEDGRDPEHGRQAQRRRFCARDR